MNRSMQRALPLVVVVLVVVVAGCALAPARFEPGMSGAAGGRFSSAVVGQAQPVTGSTDAGPATTSELRQPAGSQAQGADTVAIQPATVAAIAGCPQPGSYLTPTEIALLATECDGVEVQVAGWLDGVHELDGEAATLFPAVLRERLPGTRASHRVGTWLPVQTDELNVGLDGLLGEWLTVRVRVEAEEPCRWVFAPGGEWEPEPPAWTCPRHLQVLEAHVDSAPAAQLERCPDTSHPIRVERFAAFPRPCFGTRTVQLRGWLDTNYVIGGWEDPWTPAPAWLWGPGIGRVTVLSPSSDPTEAGALRLHIRPGSTLRHVRQNRWVIATGHYARRAETRACRAIPVASGAALPAGAPSRAEARAVCSRAFVLEAVRRGVPR